MSETWSKLRKRLAPVALVVAMGLMAREACDQRARQPVTLRFELGSGAARLRSLEVQVLADGELVGELRRGAGGAGLGAPELKVSVPGGEAELRIELELAPPSALAEAATRRSLVRRIHAEAGAAVTVPLAADLTAP